MMGLLDIFSHPSRERETKFVAVFTRSRTPLLVSRGQFAKERCLRCGPNSDVLKCWSVLSEICVHPSSRNDVSDVSWIRMMDSNWASVRSCGVVTKHFSGSWFQQLKRREVYLVSLERQMSEFVKASVRCGLL